MKKTTLTAFSLALLILCTGLPAGAQQVPDPALPQVATANATVIAPEITYITAPFSGTLLPYRWRVGDLISAEEALFQMDTTKVYATQAGTLGTVFAQTGDDAASIISRYGSLGVVEPLAPRYYLAATTTGAYNKAENKLLHTGEKLYLKSGNEKGEGWVTGVLQNAYTVEVTRGDFKLGDSVKCYRESDHATDSATGTGQVQRYEDILLSANGRVLALHKQQGDKVEKGDLLMELIGADSAPDTISAHIAAPAGGALSAIHALPGAQVYQGQLLCEIVNLSALSLSIKVDEIYLAGLALGDSLTYRLDAYPDHDYQGMIQEIRPLGTTHQNAAYFDVRIALPEDDKILPGMNATVYLQKSLLST